MNKQDRKVLARYRFFDKTVHHPKIKETISGKNENLVMRLLDNLGYKQNVDYVRQYPFVNRFVFDFAFVDEQIALEVDGKSHDSKPMVKKDKVRDRFLIENNWIPLRIQDKDLFGFKGSFYKSLIKEIVETRREHRLKGKLYPMDIPSFKEEEYD